MKISQKMKAAADNINHTETDFFAGPRSELE